MLGPLGQHFEDEEAGSVILTNIFQQIELIIGSSGELACADTDHDVR